MEFKLFDDYITLQALLKTTGILHSGGAIKGFLEENTILFNGEDKKDAVKKSVSEMLSHSQTTTPASQSSLLVQRKSNSTKRIKLKKNVWLQSLKS